MHLLIKIEGITATYMPSVRGEPTPMIFASFVVPLAEHDPANILLSGAPLDNRTD